MDVLSEVARQGFLIGMILGALLALYPIFLVMLFKKKK